MQNDKENSSARIQNLREKLWAAAGLVRMDAALLDMLRTNQQQIAGMIVKCAEGLEQPPPPSNEFLTALEKEVDEAMQMRQRYIRTTFEQMQRNHLEAEGILRLGPDAFKDKEEISRRMASVPEARRQVTPSTVACHRLQQTVGPACQIRPGQVPSAGHARGNSQANEKGSVLVPCDATDSSQDESGEQEFCGECGAKLTPDCGCRRCNSPDETAA